MTKIAVLGLGAMGRSIALALSRNGHSLTVWNRTHAKAQALASDRIVASPTVARAIAPAELVIVCVLDQTAAGQIAGDFPDMSGKVVINLTNGTPEEAIGFARRLDQKNARLLSGGIMAVPPIMGTSDALILYSGDQHAYEDHLPTLMALGSAQFMGDDLRLAPLNDLALLAGMYGVFSGAAHAFAMFRASGRPAGELAPLLKQWLGAMIETLDEMAAQVDSGDHVTGVVSNLAMQAIALNNIVAASRDLGVGPALMVPMQQLVAARVDKGHGGEDISGVVAELLAAPAV